MDQVRIIAYVLTAIFLVSAYIGYTTAKEKADIKFLEKFFEKFKGLLKLSPLLLMLAIFANNAVKSLAAMLGGFFFGIFPVLFIASNGYIIGLVVSLKESEMGLLKVLLAIIPHGVLEIPAVLIASSYGVWLGLKFYRAMLGKGEFKPYLKKALIVYFKIVVPLLFIAAFIETFITPVLASL